MTPKRILKSVVPMLTAGLMIASLSGIGHAIDDSTVTRQAMPDGSILTMTVVRLSDNPYIGDPLGNNPMRPKDDAGPALTRQPYPENCMEDRCIRAKTRQLSSTTWQQDRAAGLSLGFSGGE